MLVATPGGHMDELYEFAELLGIDRDDRIWVTARTVQTEHLLARETVEWVPPVSSRQAGRAARSLPLALSLLRRLRPQTVVSTGAALSLPYLLAARAVGAEVHYVESATRLDGPSLTGRILAAVPGVRLYHQAFRTPRPGWRPVGSVFDGFAPGPARPASSPRGLLVLGSERFPFPRALEVATPVIHSDLRWTIQHGHTPVDAADSRCHQWMTPRELAELAEQSGVVATHAGVGSVLMALRAGRHPLVLPRLGSLGEHADDHQLELARELERRNLVTVAMPGADLAALVDEAARRSTRRQHVALGPLASGPTR
ncbi:hypothetical protein BJF86_02380 [Serinicoccus sp. CNJ-927]|nr:hypothetical protein BJF86_02380 [Serinicoccus sp. CNJ-927]